MAKLTAKQEMFCREYLVDLNGTQAAIRAGYSERTACSIGVENLRKPAIAEFIAKLKAERCEEVKIDAAWVLKKAVSMHDNCEGEGHWQGVGKALEMIGKHVDVAAFKDRVETQISADDTLQSILGSLNGKSKPTFKQ